MKLIVLISANTEWRAVKEILLPAELHKTPYGEHFETKQSGRLINYFHTGWGKTASAGALQYVIDRYSPDLMVNLGTCGGIEGVVELDSVILVEKTFMYDIVDLMVGFSSVSEYYASNLDLSWLPEPYPHPVRRGILVSADSDLLPEKISQLAQQGAVAADWESAALAWVARKNNARLLILRAVSDLVSSQGGEAYQNIELYRERTRRIMRRLIGQLPDWIETIEK